MKISWQRSNKSIFRSIGQHMKKLKIKFIRGLGSYYTVAEWCNGSKWVLSRLCFKQEHKLKSNKKHTKSISTLLTTCKHSKMPRNLTKLD